MTENFDRSLDEIIKSSPHLSRKKNRQNGGLNGVRRNPSRSYNRTPVRRYQPPIITHETPAYNPVLTISNKLSISNLDYGVTESDLQSLFEEFGPIKSLTLHFDRSGRSLGTANVTYEMRQDALKALRIYNGVPLDGRPMQIEFSLPNRLQTQRIYLPPVKGYTPEALAYSQQIQREYALRAGNLARTLKTRSNNAPNFSSKRRDRVQQKQPTLEELDAELDAYISNNTKK